VPDLTHRRFRERQDCWHVSIVDVRVGTIAIGLQAKGKMMLKVAAAVIIASAFLSSAALAQNCRNLPPGPQRFECASQSHPGLLAKRERCKEEGRQMGLKPAGGLGGAGGGLRGFVMACMQRR
jgi:hypothetical protein